MHQALTNALAPPLWGNGNGVHVRHAGASAPENNEANWLTIEQSDQRFCVYLAQQARSSAGRIWIELAESLLAEPYREALVRRAGWSNLEYRVDAGAHAAM